MTNSDNNETNLENSDVKLLNQLIKLLNESFEADTNFHKTSVVINSAQSALSTTSAESNIQKVNVNYEPLHNNFFENDDEDILVVDEEIDLEKVESHDDLSDNENHDDDDDVQIGHKSKKCSAKIKNKETSQNSEHRHDEDEFNAEVIILEKFKNMFQKEYEFSESSNHILFEKILNLMITKRINDEIWLNNCSSIRNLYYVLFTLRILLRDINFQKIFLSIRKSFLNLLKLLKKFVNTYNSLQSNPSVHCHIIDLILNILTKLILNETYLSSLESNRQGSGSKNRPESSNLLQNLSQTKTLVILIFERQIHVCLLQIIEVSSELCLVHASLNILIYIANIDYENRTRLAQDLDICDNLLHILNEYDLESKRLASKLLCLLLIEEKIKSDTTYLDGIQILLSLLHDHNNLDFLWNCIWCLVQLCGYGDNKQEIRLIGGIPVILSILCMDLNQNEETTPNGSESIIKPNNENENSEKRYKVKLQTQSACCALIAELAYNETNSFEIVNSNGVYLVASKLLITSRTESFDRYKVELEKLNCNVWRTLRILFSAERHRSLIKKLIPFSMFEQFLDIGNYKRDLKLYNCLVDAFYKLSKEDIDALKSQIQFCNQTQTPTNYINDYEVYEIIGSGAFGRVHKVKKKNTNTFLAMKEINVHNLTSMKDKSLGQIVNEVTIIRNNLKHPNIVRYLKTFKENDNLYIVMELIDGSPLSQHLRSLKLRDELWSEDKIWIYFIQIVVALKYLHKEKCIIHRDLTSNNIMLGENDKITITDFGLAKLKEEDCIKIRSVVGTMLYFCPEIIKNEPYNEKADIWAIGCVLYEMCCLEPPFYTSNMLALATKITQSDYDYQRLERNSYSPQVSLVVHNCLIIDPVKRPDIFGIAALIADKILNYTDSVRNYCSNLEKKLEKEKSKTQKMLSNKQDLIYLQRNNFKLDVIDGMTYSSTSSQTSSQANLKLESPSVAYHSQFSLPTYSPNAKLPPIRHPKSKLIMKNFKNKEIERKSSITSFSSSPSSSKTNIRSENTNNKIFNRSSSSSNLEKRHTPVKKSRPNSANSSVVPSITKKLRPIEDPIVQILDQIHKILFISHLPPSDKKNFKRKLVDRFKRHLFSNKKSSLHIKAELMKLIKNSTELVDMEMIGLKSFQINTFNSSESNRNIEFVLETSKEIDYESIVNQNGGLTYEQLQIIIEDLLTENNYYLENFKHLRDQLPSFE